MFHAVEKDFPHESALEEPNKYRQSKALRQHGATVLRVLDSFVYELGQGKLMEKRAEYIVSKHIHLKEFGVSGPYFMVFSYNADKAQK